MADETNPFDGVPFGRAVTMLQQNPELAPAFDKTYQDEVEFDTLERARLHQVNSFYRGTLAGSTALKSMSDLVAAGPPKVLDTPKSDVELAQEAWAARLARGVTRGQVPQLDTPQKRWEETKKKYESVLDDLANYERMSGVGNLIEVGAALGGAIGGGILTPENIVAWPIRGATVAARMFWGGIQAGTVNVAVDPIVQAINMKTDIQKDFDWMQTALAFPLGVAIGGGLVGAGEVITRAALRSSMRDVSINDPQITAEVNRIIDSGELVAPSEVQRIEPVRIVEVTPEQLETQAPRIEQPQPEARPILEEPTQPLERPADLAPEQKIVSDEPAPVVPRQEVIEPPEPRVEKLDPRPAPAEPQQWVKIGEQKGSNPGGLYQDKNGIKWYVKVPQTEDHVNVESISNELYRLGDIYVPLVMSSDFQGKPAVASMYLGDSTQWKPLGTLDPESATYKAAAAEVRKNFAFDAWLANWDVVGLTADNILVNQAGVPARVDQGGTLWYRAQGGFKDFDTTVPEFTTMRDPKTAPEASKIFKDMSDAELIESIDRLKVVTDDKIYDTVISRMGNNPEAWDLIEILTKRRNELFKKRDELLLKTFDQTLPMDEASRKARAKKMGFDVDNVWYHGTIHSFEEFNISKAKTEKAVFLTQDYNIAKAFARGGKILTLYHRAKKITDIGSPDTEQSYNHKTFVAAISKATNEKQDAVRFWNVHDSGGLGTQLAVVKPNMLRSTSAAFDPKQKASNKLAAYGDSGDESINFDKDYENLFNSARDDDILLRRAEDLAAEQARAVAAAAPMTKPLTPSPNYRRPPESVMSLQQMSRELEETFGATIRQGRVVKGAAGHFDTQTGVIHVREFADFDLNAHEVAHKIADDLDGTTFLTSNSNMAQLANGVGKSELEKLDYDQDPVNGQRVYEGFAEFVRYFMTAPEYAAKQAPAFYSGFVNELERANPKMLEGLVKFQQAYKNYLDATPEQIGMAGVVVPEETWGSKIVARFTDAKVAPTVRNIMSLMYDATVDKFADLDRAVRAMALEIKRRQDGEYVDLAPSDDPRRHFRMLQKSAQIAVAEARDGIIPVGESRPESTRSISQALTIAFGQSKLLGYWDDDQYKKFGVYLRARRGIHLWDRYNNGDLPNPPVVESKAYLEEQLRLLETNHPGFRAGADMLHEVGRDMLRKKFESGAFYKLDREAYERILASEPFYVPFMRDRSDIPTSGGKGEGIAPGKGAYALKGSMRDVIHPVNSMLNELMAMEQQIAFSNTIRALAKFADRAGTGGGRFLEPVPAHEVKKIDFDLRQAFQRSVADQLGAPVDDPAVKAHVDSAFHNVFGDSSVIGTTFKTVVINGQREPVVGWVEGGQLKAARLSTKEEGFGLYEIMSTAPTPVAGLIEQMMSASSAVLTGTITTHIAYALRNIWRDQKAASAFVPGYIPFYHAAKGFGHLVRDDDFAQAYRQMGGVNPAGGIVPQFADAVAADVKALSRQGFNIRKVFSLKGIAEAITTFESATRLGALEIMYKQKMKHGMSEYDAWLSAVHETSDLLPFDRYGSLVGGARKVVPFLNPWIQALDKLNRHVGVPGKRALFNLFSEEKGFVLDEDILDAKKAAYAAAVLGPISVAFGFGFAALMRGERAYEDSSDRTKAVNIVIPLNDTEVLLLPKAWEMSLGFTAGEYMYAAMMRDDPRAAGQFAHAIKETMSSPNILWGNPLIGTTFSALANYNPYSGGPIVPEQLAKLAPEYQYDASTGALAKRIGKITGWSPKKIDYMLQGYFGYYGRDLSMIGRGNSDQDETSNLMDMSLYRVGIRDSAGISDARQKFWAHMGKTTGDYSQASETYKKLVSSPRTEAQGQEYYDKQPTNKKAWIVLNMAGKSDEPGAKAAFTADDRRSHPFGRAVNAVRIANGLRNTIADNIATERGDEAALVVNPNTRQKVVRTLSQLALAEMSNALIIIGEPGYAGRALIDPQVYFKQIETVAPKVAAELAKRYANEKVYKTEFVSRVYQDMQTELVRGGSNADVSLLTDEVTRNGYEFDGERTKRPRVRRPSIGGSR